jgi:hypothetical protein
MPPPPWMKERQAGHHRERRGAAIKHAAEQRGLTGRMT